MTNLSHALEHAGVAEVEWVIEGPSMHSIAIVPKAYTIPGIVHCVHFVGSTQCLPSCRSSSIDEGFYNSMFVFVSSNMWWAMPVHSLHCP